MPNLNVGLGLAVMCVRGAQAVASLTSQCQAIAYCGTPTESTSYSTKCTTTSSQCYENSTTGAKLKVTTCTACADGYVLEKRTYTSTVCPSGLGYLYSDCVLDCPSCTSCTSDTSWSTVSGYPGYQKKTTRTCDCGTCNETTEYRCNNGYYQGLATLAPSCNTSGMCTGCRSCPSATGIYTDSALTTQATPTSAVASDAKTDCYLQGISTSNALISSIKYYDNTGTFDFNMNFQCYYSE